MDNSLLAFAALTLCALGLILATLYGFAGIGRQDELGAGCIKRACSCVIAAAVLTLVGFASGCAVHMPETPGSDDEHRHCAEPAGDYSSFLTLLEDNSQPGVTCPAEDYGRTSLDLENRPDCNSGIVRSDNGCTLDADADCSTSDNVNVVWFQLASEVDDVWLGEVHLVYAESPTAPVMDCVYAATLTKVVE